MSARYASVNNGMDGYSATGPSSGNVGLSHHSITSGLDNWRSTLLKIHRMTGLAMLFPIIL